MNWTTEQWSLFWDAFGAIGGTVGALATAAAVIVALWQTKFSVRKKLKLSFDPHTVVMTPQNQKVRFVSLTVVNIGNRDVVIQKWGFRVGKKNYVIFCGAFSDRKNNYTKTPIYPEFGRRTENRISQAT